ncbi:MAG: tetratricopeptide repeat protein, partial [Spirochaetaceae bacterium]|nr:tetratricopeptide repeat protein [Spirochaetaceae bacterium]
HPLHVESVAWIIERKDVLSALFYLTAVLTWIRFDESPGPGRYALALVLFAAGLLCKSVVVTLPVALLIWHWWRRGRIAPVDLLRLAPFVAVGVAITLADLAFYASREPLELGYSLGQRALIAARALWFYAGKLVWPFDLAVIYPLWEIETGDLLAWVYLAGAAALAVVLWLARRRIGRGPLAGALLFAVTLAPVLGFIDYGYMQFSFVADRFQYLAGIGVMAVLIGAAAHGTRKLPEAARMTASGLAVALVLGLALLTWRQAGIYRDEVTLFSHIVALNPQARDAHLNLGNALIEAGRNEDGLAASRIAVEQRPESADAHSNLGLALMNLERFEEADAALRQARELDPNHQSALQNSAELLRKQGRHQEAVETYLAVLQRDGRYALAYAGLGDALFQLQRYEAAVDALGTAIAIDPGLPFAGTLYLLMGRAARSLGQLDSAEAYFREATAIAPDGAAALLDLAGVLRAQGRRDEAEAVLSRARELRPNDPANLQNIAEALRKEQRYEEALAAYREVLAIAPDYALAHAGIGDTLFRMQRFDESLETLNRALALQPDLKVAGSLHGLAGQAAQHLDRIDEAAHHYSEAVRIDPRDSSSIDRLAMVRFGRQQYEEALALYRNLLELAPDDAQTYSNLGASLYYLGRADEALRHFERAVELDPDLETARRGLEALRAGVRDP